MEILQEDLSVSPHTSCVTNIYDRRKSSKQKLQTNIQNTHTHTHTQYAQYT